MSYSKTALKYTTIAAVGGVTYHTYDPFRYLTDGLVRCARSGWVGAVVIVDYKWTLRHEPVTPEEEVKHKQLKSQVHKRSAEKILEVLKKNAGIYIKLGQHISAMSYILPDEWTETMAPLQDRCPVTSMEDIDELFKIDTGHSIDELFSEFNPIPIGVASLAQVHRATLRETGQEVAVKVQHPYLDDYSKIDIATVTFVTKVVKWAIPEFEFSWLAVEMSESLPKELNFMFEMDNARKVQRNFSSIRNTTLKIPEVYWAQRRILCMEFIDGARIDDLAFMKLHSINPNDVSTELTRIFSEMIFIQGWVHCDPHPGNIFIRTKPEDSRSHRNFEIVLLDHGLYRSLSKEFRLDYAHLWNGLISRDEELIRLYSNRVGGTNAYKLFSSVLTGREWNIVSEDLSQKRTKEEMLRIQESVMEHLLGEIVGLLAKIPRIVLLLIKTNDLLRSVDEALQTTHSERLTYVIMGRYCANAIREECQEANANASGMGSIWHWCKCYIRFLKMDVPLGMYETWLHLTGALKIWWETLRHGRNLIADA
ncbi:ubiquinone biosynthesis protein [Basidiobolus meristosporus CBS 931.73]|uniref:Ubiquinone biosynthesis protein n=1 Tax=Basidiobolus meristosporus CBS 931.73 TaxID=1314790 RepID=A0A1Y1XJV0_9FUNG|nr:ubiquinone biosynthesis protein [Basidiobolus meristosporus CBS 931.73]|eukprot:ORX86029.1 ubiquinone biosynthesis protein [Basidiobolus meristosporus CBS 931.73]